MVLQKIPLQQDTSSKNPPYTANSQGFGRGRLEKLHQECMPNTIKLLSLSS